MKAKKVTPKGPGRPATGRDPVVALRLSPDLQAAIDRWAAQQPRKASRSEAIRQLIELSLGNAGPASRSKKASDMAGREIDRIGDKSASGEERERRKRRLTKGPEEFRAIREDHPRNKA